jgi:hypothetical protein
VWSELRKNLRSAADRESAAEPNLGVFPGRQIWSRGIVPLSLDAAQPPPIYSYPRAAVSWPRQARRDRI